MSKEELLESIGQVKDEFIEEAVPKGLLSNGGSEHKEDKKIARITKFTPYIKIGALAACLCFIVGITINGGLFSAKEDAAFDSVNQMKPMEESVKTEAELPFLNNKEESGSGYFAGDYETDINQSVSNDASKAAAGNIEEDKGFPDWGLTLSVKDVTSTGLTLLVTQSGGNPTGTLLTGEPYRLICLVDGTWKKVEELPLPEGVDGYAFNSLAYNLMIGETSEFKIDWAWMFGELPCGTYRLIKEFTDFRQTGDYDTFVYWVEFIIE